MSNSAQNTIANLLKAKREEIISIAAKHKALNDRERLQDILEAISQIEKYAVRGQEEFQQNELVQVWIIHHLQIIGEASSNLSRCDVHILRLVQLISSFN